MADTDFGNPLDFLNEGEPKEVRFLLAPYTQDLLPLIDMSLDQVASIVTMMFRAWILIPGTILDCQTMKPLQRANLKVLNPVQPPDLYGEFTRKIRIQDENALREFVITVQEIGLAKEDPIEEPPS